MKKIIFITVGTKIILLGIPLENIFRIEQDYGALNIIEFTDTFPVVKLINGIIND